MIEFDAVSKQVGGRTILDGLGFGVAAGRILGLVGHNGAGKTTAIRLLTGVWKPSAGRIRVGGIDMSARPEQGRRLLGVVPSEAALYEGLTVWENINLFSGYFGGGRLMEERARVLLDQLGMGEALHQMAGRLSKGMKQKVAIVRALAHQPQVLVLDEPTTGLDVAATDALEQFIESHHRAGGTVVLCTHDMHQAVRLADQVLVLARGRACWQGERREIPTAEWLGNLVIGEGREGGRGRYGDNRVGSVASGAATPAAADLP